ncbi:MAG: protease HtpX [Proteobacteria bacterium]|nr:protease HtpX [Pseudomonadota bacterium]NBY21019.1 protease HtpX [bacterium]
MIKRIFLFVIVNILVVTTISLMLNLLGIRPYLTRSGIDYQALLAMCSVVGFTGAFISLAISRIMAKMMMGVQVIDPATARGEQKELVTLIHRLSQRAGLTTMPEVGIYNSPEVNAFATGPSKSRALVAVSTGLLNSMNPQAVEGVLGHEVAHIANGDMVTMTLVQGIVNTFVMFFARIAAWMLSSYLEGNRDREESRSVGMSYYICSYVFEILFSLLGMFVVCYFSRRREFRADAGSAQFAGREKMISALQALKSQYERIDTSHPSVATLKISGRKGIWALLSTHPSLDDRIAALKGTL